MNIKEILIYKTKNIFNNYVKILYFNKLISKKSVILHCEIYNFFLCLKRKQLGTLSK